MISHENSLRCDNVRYYSHLQWIPDQKLRKAIRKVIQGRSLVLQSDDEDDEANDSQPRVNMTKRGQQDLLDRIEAIPGVQDGMSRLDKSLKDVFSAYFGIQALGAGIEPPAVYHRLLMQLSAEESAIQTANRPALEALRLFVAYPTSVNTSRLVGIPCLYEVLEYHNAKGEGYPEHLLSLCKWMWQWGEGLLKGIIVHQAPSIDESACLTDHNWQKTGCSYTMPQVRYQPQYRYLKHDTRNEPGGRRGAKCSKYYSKYGEQRLTGGIMRLKQWFMTLRAPSNHTA
ncbi:hypothetical protein PILCRDRAFT_739791 [Piloderma croceum F 1598]|uniref:Uncharacterized protein n=1 Tax=Piloderma croceum (strain F 1598) TaxID=765440 RepID=A0A0C3B5L5_PILCF|nr:hypothetical protein PILCRDRAFT_739791 [Piloderma croceum F 1598]